jgi:hypothetical protein
MSAHAARSGAAVTALQKIPGRNAKVCILSPRAREKK